MIRRFFADGLHWIVIAYSIVGIAVYGLYSSPAAADLITPTLTVEQQR